jgi:hypothetical protein
MVNLKFEQEIKLGEDELIYRLPKMPDEKEIDNYFLASAKQKFKRQIFLQQEEFDKLTKESQVEIVKREMLRRIYGYWFFNNGIPTYITGSYYFFLSNWYMNAITEDGYGEYRYAQSKMAYFYDLVEQDEFCFGGIIMTAKRFAKTEFALADMYNIATRGAVREIGGKKIADEGCLFGMQSLNSNEARDNLFKDRILRSHRAIENYLKPKSNDSFGKKEMTSALTFFGDKQGDDSTYALNNTINHRPTKESAYQGKRPRKIFWDEPPTMEEMDILEAQKTVKQQLQIGKRAFGKLMAPATLESMKPKGAPLFEKLWNMSDPNKRDENGRTESWMLRYFNPQCEGREDFVDEYGNSLTDKAKQWKQNELDIAGDGSQRTINRQYPDSVKQCFDVIYTQCLEEDVIQILELRKAELLNNQKSAGYFACKFFEKDNEVHFRPCPMNENDFIIYEQPIPGVKYKIGIDSTGTDNQTGSSSGSKFAFSVLKVFEGIGKPNYTLVAEFCRRPEKMSDVYSILLYAARFYNKYDGLKGDRMKDGRFNGSVLPEINVGGGSGVLDFFGQKGYSHLIMGDDKNKKGLYRDRHVKELQLIRLNQLLKLYGHHMPSILMIDDLLKIGKDNTDRADGFQMSVMALGDFMKPPPVHRPPPQYAYDYVFRDGRWQEIKTPLNGSIRSQNIVGLDWIDSVDREEPTQ